MKKVFAVFLCAVLALTLGVSGAWAAYYDEGHSGDTEADAYVISTVDDLKLMRDRVNAHTESGKYYKLGADINLTAETNWKGIGQYSPYFNGQFDGQNHTITVNINTDNDDGALFKGISVDDNVVALKKLNVTGTVKATGGDFACGIVHELYSGRIEDCKFSGTVEAGGSKGGEAAGIVGLFNSGTVKNCTFSGKVQANSTSTNYAAYAGGIIGNQTGGRVENCQVLSGSAVSASAVSSLASQAGGIVCAMLGYGTGYVNGCTSNATISAGHFKGGIVGLLLDMSIRSNISGNTYDTATYPEVGNDTTTTNPPTTSEFSISSSIVPDAQADDGTPIIRRNRGESFSFNLTAQNATGEVTWMLYPTAGVDIQLSTTTGSATTVTGTLTDLYRGLIGITATDTTARAVLYTFWLENRSPYDSNDPITPDPTDPNALDPASGDFFATEGIPHVYRNISITPEDLANHVKNFNDSHPGERVISVIGPVSFDVPYYYTIHQQLDTVSPGDSLKSYVTTMNVNPAVAEGDSPVQVAANESSMIFDENWVATNTVPTGMAVNVAASLDVNPVYVLLLTTTASVGNQLPIAIIEPVSSGDVSSSILDNVVYTVSEDLPAGFTSQDIKFLSYDNLTNPLEPTDSMRSEIQAEGYQAAYKLDTVTASEDGYYLVRIILPDELVGRDAESVRLYVLERADAAGGVKTAFSPLNGLGALLDAEGLQLDQTTKTVMALLTLQAGQPFSVYLAKILLMLLSGCDAGLGLGLAGLVAVGGLVAVKVFRKR